MAIKISEVQCQFCSKWLEPRPSGAVPRHTGMRGRDRFVCAGSGQDPRSTRERIAEGEEEADYRARMEQEVEYDPATDETVGLPLQTPESDALRDNPTVVFTEGDEG